MNIWHYRQSETFSTSLPNSVGYLMPSYFCKSFNEDLDILSLWWYIRSKHTIQPTHHHCYFTVMASTRKQPLIPVISSGDLQSLRPLDMIHGTSLQGRQEDEEISSGGIQSLLTLLLATLSLNKRLHTVSVSTVFEFSSAALGITSKIQNQN